PGILPRDLDPNPARKFVPAAEIEEGAGGRGGGAGGAEGEWRAEGKYLRVGGGGGGREGGGVVVSKWCETCRIYRPPRTSHCRLCDNCVEGTDHHCAFLNNCIGRLNYLPFLSFLLSAVLCSIYSIVFSAWHIYRTTTLPHPPSNPSSSSIQWNWETIGALVVAILAFGLLVPVGGLAAYHARLVWSNRTTVEMLRPPALRASLSPTTGSIIDPNPWALSSRWANVVAVSCLICVLVSRGAPSSPGGQGSELLFFAPPSRRSRGEVLDSAKLSFVLQVELETQGRPTDEELRRKAGEVVREGLLLDAREDLRLVRCSHLLPYTLTTHLVSFLYRTSPSYERGFELLYAEASGALPPAGGEASKERGEQEEIDKTMYRVVEKRLGRGAHSWEAVEEVERKVGKGKQYEHLSLSLSLVVLPPVLDEALHFASSLSNLSAVDVADLALNTMLQLVRQRAGEGSFIGCWPAGVSTGMETKSLPDGVVKHRMMLFFRDVVAYQFRLAKSAYAPTLSAVFLRVLLPLVPLSLSPSISLPAFRQATLDSIAAEAARSRFAAATVDKTAVAKLLEYASREKRRVLHIVTAAGGDPLVFGVLRELVHYVSTISASPYSSTNPHIHATSHALEVEWASRPNLLHLTLAESRPLCLGAVLASRLYDVLLSSRTRATQLRQLASSYDNPYVHHPLSPGTTSRKLPSGLKKRVLAGRGFAWTKDDPQRPQPDERVEETAETYGTLDRLLKKAEVGVHAFPPPPAGLGAAKVRIEVAPDNALASAMKESKGGRGDLVVLIGAEAVLPGWGGDVMAAMGSWSLAQLAKMLGAKVYAVAASDLILPSSGSPPSSAQHDPSELYSGWATTLAAELEELDPFALSLAAGNEPDARVWTKASEVVPGGLIDGYITEKGVLSVGGCVQLAKERGVAEATLYGDR
ncbi:hypothetical protein JCM10213_007643, partial [Rhodosporidiobolus nylandii]